MLEFAETVGVPFSIVAGRASGSVRAVKGPARIPPQPDGRSLYSQVEAKQQPRHAFLQIGALVNDLSSASNHRQNVAGPACHRPDRPRRAVERTSELRHCPVDFAMLIPEI